jgi:hypothetical protein
LRFFDVVFDPLEPDRPGASLLNRRLLK